MTKQFAARQRVSKPSAPSSGAETPDVEHPAPVPVAPAAPVPALRLQPDHHDLGARLRAARLAQRFSLQDVAAATKISARALEALEANDTARLPGGIFSRGFVKTYAEHLGLDPAEAVRQFLDTFPEPVELEHQTAPAWPAHAAARQLRELASPALLGPAVVILAILLTGAGLYWTLARSASPQPTEAAASTESASSGTIPAPPPADPLLGARPSSPAASPASTGGPSAAAPTDGLPDPSGVLAAALAKEQIEIAIEAVAPCWVRVMIDGEVAFARVMRPGERESRTGTDQIVLDVGDAGAFRYTINGVPGRWLGRKGQVITARISRDNLATFLQP